MPHPQSKTLIIIAICFTFWACNGADFSSSNRKAPAGNKDPNTKDHIENNDQKKIKDDNEFIGRCIDKDDVKINILLVFDTSGSLKKTDPQNIRRQAGLNFIKRFSKSGLDAKAEIWFNAASFNQTFSAGKNGWSISDGSTTASTKINSDILDATGFSDKGTYYNTAFAGALGEYSKPEFVASGNGKLERSYMLFFTDGAPTDAGDYQYAPNRAALETFFVNARTIFMPNVAKLVDTFGVSIFTIAAVDKLNTVTNDPADEDVFEKVLKDIAEVTPQSTSLQPQPGQYYRVKVADDLVKVSDDIFQNISEQKCR